MRIFLLLLLPLLVLPPCICADELTADVPVLVAAPTSLERMVGERLVYDIAFLWFDNLAQASLSLEAIDPPGTYRATLEAQTLGVAAWLTSDRMQHYVSVMEKTAAGRLRSLFHESQVIKGQGRGRKARTKRYTFDYEKNEVLYQRAREGRFYKEEVYRLRAGTEDLPPADILTAFYNFRAGFFGPVQPGGEYVIPAFDKEGASRIQVEILLPEERKDQPFFPDHGLLGRISVDEEVFDTGGGNVYVWFDEQGRPLRGIVENVLGIGDVRGTLRD